MSAPETNVENQSKRHRPAIWGMIAAALFAAILFLAYLANLAAQGNDPGDEAGSVNPGAGASVDADS